VAPPDIRWVLAIGGPRVRQTNSHWHRRNGLTPRAVARGVDVIARALEGHRHLTRQELAAELRRSRIRVEGQALAGVVMEAELEGVICSGPRRGAQFTYALLDERVPPAPARSLDESLQELTRRYFTSHGPATVRDFVWWSGLTVAQAKAGLSLAGETLTSREIDGKTYWLNPALAPRRFRSPLVHLLPIYDEFLIAFKDREWCTPVLTSSAGVPALTPNTFVHQLVIDGRVEGFWTITARKEEVSVSVAPFGRLAPAHHAAVAAAAQRYGRVLQRPVTLTVSR
jgi:hypothetical protein